MELDDMSPCELHAVWRDKMDSSENPKEERKAFYKAHGLNNGHKNMEYFWKRSDTKCILGSAMKHYILDCPIEEFEPIRQKHIENTYYNICNITKKLDLSTVGASITIIDADHGIAKVIDVVREIDTFVILISQRVRPNITMSILFENVPNRIFIRTSTDAREETDHTITTLLGSLHCKLPIEVEFIVISRDIFIFALENIYKSLGRELTVTLIPNPLWAKSTILDSQPAEPSDETIPSE